MTAAEYFAQVRAAALEIAQEQRTIERLRSREGVKGKAWDAVGHTTGVGDPYETTRQRMDFELRIFNGQLEDAEKVVEEGMEVLYGRDGRGGLARMAGTKWANVVHQRDCMAKTWSKVAYTLDMSRSQALRLYSEALDLVDDFGLARLKEGEGQASI